MPSSGHLNDFRVASESIEKGSLPPLGSREFPFPFQSVSAHAPILDSHTPTQYGPRGLGAAELS